MLAIFINPSKKLNGNDKIAFPKSHITPVNVVNTSKTEPATLEITFNPLEKPKTAVEAIKAALGNFVLKISVIFVVDLKAFSISLSKILIRLSTLPRVF